MTTIKIYNWPTEMRYRRADVGYSHASVAGTAYFSGRPQGETLALPKRMTVEASGPLQYKGAVEVVRYAIEPNNLIRSPDPTWCRGRSQAVRNLAANVVWDEGAEWASGAAWGSYIGLCGDFSEGDTTLSMCNLPPSEQIFRSGDLIGVGGAHYMVRAAASSDAEGVATVSLVRGLTAGASEGDQVEYPVKHLFMATIPQAEARDLQFAYDWTATMTEVFKSEFDGVTFEDASFFN